MKAVIGGFSAVLARSSDLDLQLAHDTPLVLSDTTNLPPEQALGRDCGIATKPLGRPMSRNCSRVIDLSNRLRSAALRLGVRVEAELR